MRAGSAQRIWLVAALLGVARLAHAGFEDDYAAGLKALDAGRLPDAQRLLQKAYASESEPLDRINLDGNMQPYLPLHFLGVVAYRLGDCTGADKYWNSQANKRMTARLNALRQQEATALANCKPATTVAEAPKPGVETKPAAPEPAAPTPAKPPEALVSALQNYLAGRYLAATRIDPATLPDARAKFHAYLVRAAARFMLASTGLGDQSLVDAARGDVRAARALDAKGAPDAATFPPRFRAFWDATR